MGSPRHVPLVTVAALAAALSAACGRSSPPPASTSSTANAPAPAAAGPRLYVSDETGGAIVVIDPQGGQVLERIAVGKRPRGLHLSRDGRQLLVALSGSPIGGPGVDESALPPADRAADGIGVVDLASRKVVRTYPSGVDPESFDISPDGNTVYVSNEDTGEMSVLDLVSGEIRQRVTVGAEPEGITVRPDGRVVYVSCEGDNEVLAIDTSTFKVLARIATGARPRAVVFTADNATALVTNENSGTVTLVDAGKHSVVATIEIQKPASAPTPARPMGLALSDDGRRAFVSLGRARAVAVIDPSARRVVGEFGDVGTRPWGIALSTDGRALYTANGPSGDVSVVDVTTGAVTRRISTGGSPWGVVESR